MLRRESVPAANTDSYEELMEGMNERAEEARKGIVSVEPVQSERRLGKRNDRYHFRHIRSDRGG